MASYVQVAWGGQVTKHSVKGWAGKEKNINSIFVEKMRDGLIIVTPTKYLHTCCAQLI